MGRYDLSRFATSTGVVLALLVGVSPAAAAAAPLGRVVPSSRARRPSRTEAELVGEVTRKLDRLAFRLGIDVPTEVPQRARVRFVSHSLEQLLERGGSGLAEDGLPVELLRYLTAGIARLDRGIWDGSSGTVTPSERAVTTRLSGVLDAIHGKLDRWNARVSSADGPHVRTKTAPSNDDCPAAEVIGNESVVSSTIDATNDASASCGDSATAPDVWYRYVAPESGWVRFSTADSDYDPVLTLFDACPGSGGTELVCDDDSAGTTDAMVTYSVTAGQEILVRISGFSGATGGLTLTAEPTSGITGTVTKAISGDPIAGARVSIWSNPLSPFPVRSVLTDAAGNYTAVGLGAGTYFAEIEQTLNQGFAGELYQEIPCTPSCTVSDGTPISLTAGAVTGGIDFTLEPLGAISGRVTASDPMSGDPVGEVYVWRSDGTFAGSVFLAADGSYRFDGVAPGTYFVSTDTYTHLDELFDGFYCHDSLCDPTAGTPVVVDPGATTSGIDFQLEDLSTITGTVTRTLDGTPLNCSSVRAVSTDGTVDRTVPFDSSGVYSIQSLPPRDYRVVTDCPGYFDEVWDDVHCPPGCDLSAGTPVTVPVASTVDGIDFSLDQLGAIEGAVYSKVLGTPVKQFMDVVLMSGDGTEIERDRTDSLGGYFLLDVYPGQYLLKAEWDDSVYPPFFQNELYDNVPCAGGCSLADGTLVPVAVNTTISGIDFYLSHCSADSYVTVKDLVTSELVQQACEVLTVGPNVTVTQNGSVLLQAGKEVVLGDGFALGPGVYLSIGTDPNLSTEDQ